MVVDEEQEANATDSPFKSTTNEIFRKALLTLGLAVETVFDNECKGILKWFKYLTKFFMPTSPIWSNLLLGKYFM